MFGVSRSSVREGLRILELLEVVEVRQGRGAIVLERDGRSSGRLLRRWLTLHHDEVGELLEVREALEATAAAKAATWDQASPIDPEPPAAVEVDALAATDVDFHMRVARRSGNQLLADLIEELNGMLEASRYAMFAIPGRHERSLREHAAIAAAINANDPAAAATAMREHIRATREDVESHANGPRR
jgi:GntR family transcriptional repressor for pyruvate dehydrogenase complex